MKYCQFGCPEDSMYYQTEHWDKKCFGNPQVHIEDCSWRQANDVRHSDAGAGECDCKCHNLEYVT